MIGGYRRRGMVTWTSAVMTPVTGSRRA
jgi:hypothetical protein